MSSYQRYLRTSLYVSTMDVDKGGAGDAIPTLGHFLPDNNELLDATTDPNERERVTSYQIDLNKVDQAFQEHDGDVNLVSSLRETLHLKYNRLVRIIKGADLPERYYFHDEADKYEPQVEEYHRIIPVSSDKDVFEEFKSMWQKINDEAQEGLFFTLMAARGIFRRVVFDVKMQSWVPRTRALTNEERISQLYYYGNRGQEQTILEYLSHGRSMDEMCEAMKKIHNSPLYGCHKLADVWQCGLTAGMTNGDGRCAVYHLLDQIMGLITALDSTAVFPDGAPKVLIMNVTSSTADDGLSIISSPLPSQTTSASSSNPPSPKRKRVTSANPSLKQKQSTSNKKPEEDAARKVITWSCNNRKFVDLKVACIDGKTGKAKYLLLAEIHSGRESFTEALKTFYNDGIATLQAQEEVFGLFFGMKEVMLITFTKQEDKSIYFSEKKYHFLAGSPPFNMFKVNSFQILVMDIFSLLIYGMKNMERTQI